MLFDNDGITGQFEHLVVTKRELLTTITLDADIARRDAGAGIIGIDHLDGLVTTLALDDRPLALGQRRFKDVVLVRIDLALDDVFTEAIGGRDEDDIVETGLEREHNAGYTEVGAHHLLYAD